MLCYVYQVSELLFLGRSQGGNSYLICFGQLNKNGNNLIFVVITEYHRANSLCAFMQAWEHERVCVVGGDMCQGTCVEVSGQLTGISSLLLTRGSGE